MYNDWDLTGDYIVTRESSPIVLRFVADITDVNSFDNMFFEGFAASLAQAVFPRLAGPAAKRSDVMIAYNTAMAQARIVNGIETGAEEPQEDDLITCRR